MAAAALNLFYEEAWGTSMHRLSCQHASSNYFCSSISQVAGVFSQDLGIVPVKSSKCDSRLREASPLDRTLEISRPTGS